MAKATLPKTNGQVIESEIAWFTELVDRRFRIHGGELPEEDILAALPPPRLRAGLAYADALARVGAGPSERLVLILALMPHLRPQALDPFLITNQSSDRRFTEFGGADAGGRSGFRPTQETALFLLAGENMDRRLTARLLFDPDAPLQELGVLCQAEAETALGPWLPLEVTPRWRGRFLESAPRRGIAG